MLYASVHIARLNVRFSFFGLLVKIDIIKYADWAK